MRATCPSGRCNEGSLLLGIVGQDGLVGYITPGMTVDAQFVSRARQGRTPESRLRFAEPCAEDDCAQWTGDRCGLIDELLDSPKASTAAAQNMGLLPRCSIRRSCRWFDQHGSNACGICPLI